MRLYVSIMKKNVSGDVQGVQQGKKLEEFSNLSCFWKGWQCGQACCRGLSSKSCAPWLS